MKLKTLFGVASASLLLTACVTPTIQAPPKQEAGKGAVVLYSSTLQPTSYVNYTINNDMPGTIDGGKVQVVYLKPGNYQFSATVPYIAQPVSQQVRVAAGENYFLNLNSKTTRTKTSITTTYQLDLVSQDAAMHYLQGPQKFTGWGDLVTNTLNGKQFQ